MNPQRLDQTRELRYLKDSIPKDFVKNLYAEESLQEAWSILDRMYGDKTMILQKLK